MVHRWTYNFPSKKIIVNNSTTSYTGFEDNEIARAQKTL